MNYHIVRTNDKIETIMNLYNLTKEEIKDLNTHISSWDHLIPGTRIKLPKISEALANELNDVEPFIEDYYPKIDLKRYESVDDYIDNNSNNEDVESNDIYPKEEVKNNSIYNKEEENTINKEENMNIQKGNFNNSIKLPSNYSYYYNPYEYYRILRNRRNRTNTNNKNY